MSSTEEKRSMKQIKILGSGCRNCQTTYELINKTASELGVTVQVEKVEDVGQIMGYGVMSTPGVVIDGKVVHSGGLPTRAKIEQWLAGATAPAEPAAGRCCG